MKSRSISTYIGHTTSTCPECLELVNAKVIFEHGKVYFRKFCPRHGHSSALVSEDIEHYLKTREFSKPGMIPHRFASKVRKGCPYDCGLCPDHEQHTCHPIVEITDRCNLNCPICLADNRHRGFMPVARFRDVVDNLIACEGTVENITLSGGEPSLHPDFWELVSIADRPEVSRASLVTNGIRIADDEDFCRKLRENNIYVLLQWDGFGDEVYSRLRGQPLKEIKERALEHIVKYSLATQLIFVAARGVNEDQIGSAVRLMLDTESILSIAFQPLAFTTPAGRLGPDDNGAMQRAALYNPMDRITVPGVIKALVEQTAGFLVKDDFIPLPCSNPECVSLTYLLRLDDSAYIPFPRFADMKRYLHLLSGSATIEPNRETESAIHEIINDLWSTAGEVPDSGRITKALKRAAIEMFRQDRHGEGRELVRATERQAKSIFIHHYMDRYNFDLGRLIKCCHHYQRADNRIMPVCSFNLFHRAKEVTHFVA